jgi:cytochrome P450
VTRRLRALVEELRVAEGGILICRPRDSWASAVDTVGDVLIRGPEGVESGVRIHPAGAAVPDSTEQFIDDPRVPIVTSRLVFGDRSLELRAVGHVDALRRRIDVVRWRLSNRTGGRLRRESIHTEITSGDERDICADRELRVVPLADFDGRCVENRLMLQTEPFDIAPGSTATGWIAYRLDGPPWTDRVLGPTWVEEVFSEERRFWVGCALDSDRFHVPDRSTMDLALESHRVMLQRGDDDRMLGDDGVISTIRGLVVDDSVDGVELLAGIPDEWLHPGAELVIADTHTRFGAVSVRELVTTDNDVTVVIDTDWVERPGRIVVRPPTDTTGVTVQGRRVGAAPAGIVVEPARSVAMVFTRTPIAHAVDGHLATKVALRSWSTLSSAHAFKPDIRDYRQLPLESDRPDHREYRFILEPWFRRSRLVILEPEFRMAAAGVVREFTASGHADAVSDLALPMFVRSLAIVLGRPQDVDEWLGWGVAMNVVDGHRDGHQTDGYIARVLDEVAAKAGTDVFSAIAKATLRDRELTRAERIGLASMVLTAGRAATINLLAGAMWLLATRPDDRSWLTADRARIGPAIEEVLRYLSPAPEMSRVIMSDRTGCPIGSETLLSFVSANYDEAVFDRPEDLDLARSSNPHLAFGSGPHICLGANLARIQARVFIDELLHHSPGFELDGEPTMTWQRVGAATTPRDFESVPLVITR